MPHRYLISIDRQSENTGLGQLEMLAQELQAVGIALERFDQHHVPPRWINVTLSEELAESIAANYPALIIGAERSLSF